MAAVVGIISRRGLTVALCTYITGLYIYVHVHMHTTCVCAYIHTSTVQLSLNIHMYTLGNIVWR